jgi:plasmid maintenance system antidote protein VapI
MSKLNKLPVKNEVIHQLAIGETQTNIAKQVGVDRSQISRLANEDKNIQLIEEEREKLVKVLPDAVENVKTLVEGMKDVPEDNIKKLELCYKASKDTLKATGLFPSPQFAHNIYNDNRTQTVIELGIMKLFSTEFSQNMQVIDMNEENLNME